MKKSTFFIFTLCMILHAAFSQVFAYDNLWIIGDGCGAGWNWSPGNSYKLSTDGAGIFTWTGTLNDGSSNNNRFKFIFQSGTWNALTCEYTTKNHLMLTSGIETDIYERYNNCSPCEDVCFRVSETAVYDIVINTNTMKITVTKQQSVDLDAIDLEHLWVTGGAVPAGWSLPGTAMTKTASGEFVWACLIAPRADGNDPKNGFKFNNRSDKWEYNINPNTDYNFTTGVEYPLTYRSEDKKFFVTPETAGWYEIHINLNTMKAWFVKVPDLSQLYMVGDATSVQWNPSSNAPLTKIANGVFSWTGHLNQGEMKFMNQPGWEKNINPTNAFNLGNPTVLNTEYDLVYRPLNETPPADNKFYIATAGEYTVNVNLNTMKANIKEAVNNNIVTDTPWDLSATPYTGGNIVFNEDAQLENATNLTVAGVVKIVKTFDTAKWYPVGFPFAINDIQIKYGITTVQGQIYENDKDQIDYTSGGLSASTANMFVKYYNGETNRFHFTDAIVTNAGYAIQFSKADLENVDQVEVTFTSAPNPHLYSATGTVGDYDDSDYTLIVNPNVANISALTDANDYYQFDYYSNPADYPNGHYARVGADELATELKPFEAIVVYSGISGQQNRVIGAGNVMTGLDEIAKKDSVIAVHYYNLQGIEIAAPVGALHATPLHTGTGVYIVKTVYQSGAISVNKIIRK